jgi:outer membrane protein assembly factor BamB
MTGVKSDTKSIVAALLCVAVLMMTFLVLVPRSQALAASSKLVTSAGLSSHSKPRTITSPKPQTSGYFGISIAVSGSTLLVGAYNENASGYEHAGRAYIFNATTGARIRTLRSPEPQGGGGFGDSVAISGTTVVVGAEGEGAGHVYVFNAMTGALIHTLTSPNGQIDGNFGSSVAISGTTVVVGADFETASGHSEAGHAYVFQLT